MGVRSIKLNRQKVVDFLMECCDETFIGDMLKGEVNVSSVEAHVGVPMMGDRIHHEIEVTVLLDIRR